MAANFIEECKKDIIDRLEDLETQDFYLCDIGFELTMDENNTGSWYCNSYKAKEELFENMEVFSRVWNELSWNIGPDFAAELNPFEDPEKTHVILMINLYEMIFNQAVSDFPEWNEMITIDSEFISRVSEAMKVVSLDY